MTSEVTIYLINIDKGKLVENINSIFHLHSDIFQQMKLAENNLKADKSYEILFNIENILSQCDQIIIESYKYFLKDPVRAEEVK